MPIITLTTDFGVNDFYVAAMKAVLLRQCPGANLIDVTHQIAPHDLISAAFTLERAISSFDAETIHLAVVDPGVGSDRRMMVARVKGATVICPDNGLISWAWRRHADSTANELIWRPEQFSNTFHGRDIMAPVAGMIAAGMTNEKIIGQKINPVLLQMQPSQTSAGEVIQIDHFGNATTNILREHLPAEVDSFCFDRLIIPFRQTYSDVAIGEVVALIGSSDLVEIAVRNGSAAGALNLRRGDQISARLRSNS
jgi:S-adenosylmethionine hydrolase